MWTEKLIVWLALCSTHTWRNVHEDPQGQGLDSRPSTWRNVHEDPQGQGLDSRTSTWEKCPRGSSRPRTYKTQHIEPTTDIKPWTRSTSFMS